MAIYEYLCACCQLKFEVRRPFSESAEPAPCPRCQKLARKVPSLPAAPYAKDAEGYTAPVAGRDYESNASDDDGDWDDTGDDSYEDGD